MIIGSPLFGWFTHRHPVTPAGLTFTRPAPPAAAVILQSLATAALGARSAPASTSATRVAHTLRREWRLGAAPNGPPAALVIATDVETWVAPSGQEIQARWPASRPRRVVISHGQLSGFALAAMSQAGLPREKRPGPTERADQAIVDVAQVEPVPGAIESSLLRRLAHSPGLTYPGLTTDRVGRPGEAITLTRQPPSAPRYTFVFSPRTGALLEVDTIAGARGAGGAPAGSVIAYEVFLSASWIARLPGS